MSPLLMRGPRTEAPPAPSVHDRAADLTAALDSGGRQLDQASVGSARAVLTKVDERTAIAGTHTVVALAGATGSGKSSLFNALVGMPVAEIGARRPTTSRPTAAVWGDDAAGDLLDWLQVPQRHGVATPAPAGVDAAETTTADPEVALDGLVLLDLPDFDSREQSHRAEAGRVLALADVFVWVTDPQKYADALLHDDYVRRLARHASVMLVVLNQVDRLTPESAETLRDDLQRLLREDGVPGVEVLATSAVTGTGIPELRSRLGDAVAGREATRRRLAADLGDAAALLRQDVGDREVGLEQAADESLVEALSRAAGVPVVLAAVEQDYRREAHGRAGWVFTRWGRQLRPDPLKRLRLDRSAVLAGVDEGDVREVLGRSSIPAPSAAARSAVKLAALNLTHRASEGLPVLWAEAVSDAAAPTDDRLYEELDRVMVSTPLRGNPPAWWRLLGLLQILFGLAAVAGLVWLVVLGVIGWLKLPELVTPYVGPVPLPTLLLGGGLVLGLLFAWLARGLARVGARRRRTQVAGRLRSAIADVATSELVVPVGAVLERHRLTRERLDAAEG